MDVCLSFEIINLAWRVVITMIEYNSQLKEFESFTIIYNNLVFHTSGHNLPAQVKKKKYNGQLTVCWKKPDEDTCM